jgi:hypothetical protein
MDAYVFQVGMLCADCAQTRIIGVEAMPVKPAGYPSDSKAYPQGPYPEGGGEADTPQHCDDCQKFLQNPLTDSGYAYVAELLSTGRGSVLKEWAKFYQGDDDGLDEAISDTNILSWFRNFYRHCGKEWTDEHSHQCNDRCPKCGAEIEPYKSEDA